MPTFITGRARVPEKGVEAEFRLPPLVEIMEDEMLSPVKIELPVTVVGDIPRDDPFSVDGEEGGSGGVVDEGEEGIPPPDDEVPLPGEELLEPGEGFALLLPLEEPPLGGGEPVEGEELSPVESGGVGICTGAGEG